ncbi:MAG: DUF4924 family protein [Bacteroidota bacterium]
MIVARQKKQNNIAEYVLYMWQVEDLVRAFAFDLDKLEQNVFGSFADTEELKSEIRNWYADIIQMMQMEQIKNIGHLQITKNVIIDLNGLHQGLLKNPEEKEYIAIYQNAAPNIIELSKKLNSENENEIQIMFHGLYGLLLMRMKKREVTGETTVAMSTFSDLLSLLAKKYHEREKKERTQWDS